MSDLFHPGVKKGWEGLVEDFAESEEGKALKAFLAEETGKGKKIFPPIPLRALTLIDPQDVKVVILGQDPYHGEHQANGLAFSVYSDIKIPPSLRNIFKEIKREFPDKHFENGDLTRWAEQGVLLLNAVLTVEESKPASHRKKGWEKLTDSIVDSLSKSSKPIVFMLWGADAQKRAAELQRENNLVLCSNHPSPLSATRGSVPFIGNNHFEKANEWLVTHGLTPIEW